MKKTDAPQFFEGLKCDHSKVEKVVQQYINDPKLYITKLENHKVILEEMKQSQEKLKKQQEAIKESKDPEKDKKKRRKKKHAPHMVQES